MHAARQTDPMDKADAAATLAAEILEHIPLTRAMQIAISRYTGDELEMTAPLAPNINDKGCAFGGSMTALLTLAGWGLIELGMRAAGLECDIYVGDTQVRYNAPVWGALRGVARFAEAGALAPLVASVRTRGKGHVDVACEIVGEAGAAATLSARFFARLHAPA
ncbi:MAG: thioesterase [Rhodanobacteraceae bacterium]|nr:MAG: thioesterase [Rhodanobacteraceae bacterium]